MDVSKIEVNKSLKETVLEAVDSIGGFGNFINQGETVLIKPNFNTPDPFPASSDLEFIKVVTELIYEYGAKKVIIAESSTMSMNSRKVMDEVGVFELEKMNPAPDVRVLDEGKYLKKEIIGGKYLKKVSLPELLYQVDKLILLPCLKTHSYSKFTGSLKLSVGFMKSSERIRLHLNNLEEKIAELNSLINPNLIIMDGRKCFITKGPSKGEVREPNVILASTSRVLIDIEGIKIIQSFKGNSLEGIDPLELAQIKRAREIKIT